MFVIKCYKNYYNDNNNNKGCDMNAKK